MMQWLRGFVSRVPRCVAPRLQSVTKEGLSFGDEDAADVKKREKYYKNLLKPLTDSLKDTFKGKITKVW